MASFREQALRRKPVREMAAETGTDTGRSELKRSIGLVGLTAIGIGGTIGTGIFFILSQAVPMAGPAVVWSFVLAAIVAGLTAVCYAELAGAVPVAGSSYSYAYATLGELTALCVGACLLLEWGVAAAAVAVGWSEYVNQLLDNLFGFQIPEALSNAPEQGGVFNLPAVLLVVMCALLLMRGASESAKTNAVMVAIKIAVLIMFIVIGATGWDSANLSPFTPFGVSGVTAAAGVIFFSFIGLDGVATAGEEAKNPRRNLPLAIMISLLIVTTLYVLTALIAVAAQPYSEFEDQEAGLAQILQNVTGSSWPGTALAAGAIISIFSVTLVSLYGQTRILFAMSRDGMIPELFHKVNPRTLTPVTEHDHRRHRGLAAGGSDPDQLPRRDDQHRHPRGVHHRLHRCHRAAANRPGPGAQLQGSVVSGDPDPGDSRGAVDHLQPAGGHALCVRDLDRRRAGVVLRLRTRALTSRQARACRPGRGGHPAMTILVGYPPNKRGKSVLGLAAMLARSSGENLVVCTVVPAPWLPGLVREDTAYQGYVDGMAESALAHARAKLLPDVSAEFVRVRARSAPSGLLEAAEQHQATVIVVGSSAAGLFGHITLSSVADRLLHSSPVPVALATRGFRTGDVDTVTRLTVAYTGTEEQRPAGAGGAGGGAPARCSHSAGGLRRPGRTSRYRPFQRRGRGTGHGVDGEHSGSRQGGPRVGSGTG